MAWIGMISDTSSIYYVSEQCCFYTNWIVTLLFTVFCIFFLKNKTEVCKALGKSVNEGNVIKKYLWDHRRPEL